MAVFGLVHLILFGVVLVGTGAARHPTPSPSVEHEYVLNARIRPLLLFWIGRDHVGAARITWQNTDRLRTIELLVGTDPDRAPRQINRWGLIKEDVSDGRADIIGVMTASDEQSLDEAESAVESRRASGGTLFKGVRTTVWADHAVTHTATIAMPERASYRELDAVLKRLRAETSAPRRVARPAGTHTGFLFAMTSLIRHSLAPCRASRGSRVRVDPVTYLYNQTLYDASLVSCSYEPELHTKIATFRDVIDARFQVRNRRTGHETRFSIAYAASGGLRERPVRIVFRPRWWMEAELLLEVRP
jgi:hypothetical protein